MIRYKSIFNQFFLFNFFKLLTLFGYEINVNVAKPQESRWKSAGESVREHGLASFAPKPPTAVRMLKNKQAMLLRSRSTERSVGRWLTMKEEV